MMLTSLVVFAYKLTKKSSRSFFSSPNSLISAFVILSLFSSAVSFSFSKKASSPTSAVMAPFLCLALPASKKRSSSLADSISSSFSCFPYVFLECFMEAIFCFILDAVSSPCLVLLIYFDTFDFPGAFLFLTLFARSFDVAGIFNLIIYTN